MSNFLAIATVTEAFRQMLDAAVGRDVSGGARATAVRPTGSVDGSSDGLPEVGVNVYLYQVSANHSWRNADLPTRRGDSTMIQRPRAALDLHYLLTSYGDEKRLEPQRVLGSVVRVLHAQPMLARQQVRSAIDAVDFLSGSDLADEVEQVKFTPVPLSVEELYNLWSGFFQTPYTLSTAYQASVVFIEGEETPQEALPVRARNLYAMPFRQPVIERIASQVSRGGPVRANQPVLPGYRLVIEGKNLQGDVTRVRIGGVGVEVEPDEVGESRIRLSLSSPPLPPDSLRAGVRSVQVVHQMMIGTPPVPHRGVESNVEAFVLRPDIKSVDSSNLKESKGTVSGDVTVSVDPMIGKSQRAVLLLNELSGASDSPAAYTFASLPRDEDAETITVPFTGVRPGDYLVRLQVDGAESLLDVDEDPESPTYNRYVGPKLAIKKER